VVSKGLVAVHRPSVVVLLHRAVKFRGLTNGAGALMRAFSFQLSLEAVREPVDAGDLERLE
jgi:hypothetical protein